MAVGENSRKEMLRPSAWARETLGLGLEEIGRAGVGQNVVPEAVEGLEGSKSSPLTASESSRGRVGQEGLRHEYWKRVWAEKMAQDGYQVAVEAPRRGGRVDVLAVKGDERIGVEIETGESDVVRNVRNGLLYCSGRMIVMAVEKPRYVPILQ